MPRAELGAFGLERSGFDPGVWQNVPRACRICRALLGPVEAGILACKLKRRPAARWHSSHRDGAQTRSRGRRPGAVGTPRPVLERSPIRCGGAECPHSADVGGHCFVRERIWGSDRALPSRTAPCLTCTSSAKKVEHSTLNIPRSIPKEGSSRAASGHLGVES